MPAAEPAGSGLPAWKSALALLSDNAGEVWHREPMAEPQSDVSAQAGASAYALLTDGTTIEIRPARPDDFDAVRDMHAKMSPEESVPAHLRHGPARGRAGSAPDMPRVRAGPRCAAGGAGGPGGRLRQLRTGGRRFPVGGDRHGGCR